MKTIDSALLATYQSAAPTIVAYIEITRTDLQVFRLVAHDRDIQIDGNVYEAAPGFDLSSLVSTEGFAVDNAEFKLLDGDYITRADVYAGVWDSAVVEIGEVDWKAAAPVKNILKRGKVGNWTPKRGYCTVEFRDLRQAIQNPHETVMQPTCRYQLGVRNAVSHCPVILADWTVTGTIDSSASQYTVTDAARTEAEGHFAEGTFTATSGLNAGRTQKIKSFSGGVFVFWAQFVLPFGNDDYSAVAGCRLRFQEDCIAKFNVGIDFGGEPNKPNPDALTAPATADAP